VIVSDGLFGNCQKSGRLLRDIYQYQLTGDQRQQLERILLTLIESGYGWSHQYTQCVIGNVLLAYRSGFDFDLGFCTASRFTPESSDRWTSQGDDDEIVPSWLTGGSFNGFPPEIRQTADRPPPSSLEEDYLSVPEADSQQANDVEEILRGLSSDDLDKLEKYVVDDVIKEDLSKSDVEPPAESEETDVVRRLSEDEQRLNDDVGELIVCVRSE